MGLIITTEKKLRAAIRQELDAPRSPGITMPREAKGSEAWKDEKGWVGARTSKVVMEEGKRGY